MVIWKKNLHVIESQQLHSAAPTPPIMCMHALL